VVKLQTKVSGKHGLGQGCDSDVKMRAPTVKGGVCLPGGASCPQLPRGAPRSQRGCAAFIQDAARTHSCAPRGGQAPARAQEGGAGCGSHPQLGHDRRQQARRRVRHWHGAQALESSRARARKLPLVLRHSSYDLVMTALDHVWCHSGLHALAPAPMVSNNRAYIGSARASPAFFFQAP